jgi:hypothetical protein
MILKDADALDRGRFAGPCAGTDFNGTGCDSDYCSKHSGCAYHTLRLNYEGIESPDIDWPFRLNLALAAMNLARATNTSPWDFNAPVPSLIRWIRLGQERISK